jgi:hypothetical protein
MVTKWSSSAYTTWLKMNEEYGENAFSYKNIGKRFVRLAQNNIIEEVKLETVENLHGRKDYKVTVKGLEQLIPYLVSRPEEVQNIVQYMDKFSLDKKRLWNLLVSRLISITEIINDYAKYSKFIGVSILEITDKEVQERVQHSDKIMDRITKLIRGEMAKSLPGEKKSRPSPSS